MNNLYQLLLDFLVATPLCFVSLGVAFLGDTMSRLGAPKGSNIFWRVFVAVTQLILTSLFYGSFVVISPVVATSAIPLYIYLTITQQRYAMGAIGDFQNYLIDYL